MSSNSPLATRTPTALEVAPTIQARAISGDGLAQLVRVEQIVRLPAAFQYVIPARKKVGGDWVDDNKVGITSDGYDYANRTLGVSFFLPEFVPDELGQLVRNPIHRADYIFIGMGGVWRNEAGQLVGLVEYLEVNYAAIYTNARLESQGAEIVMDEKTGLPVFDANGQPTIVIRDFEGERWEDKKGERGREKVKYTISAAEQEKKALKALYQLRTMGPRYAQTVLRTRITKVALGVKSLPIQQPQDFPLRVVGWQDNMTPDERVKEATRVSATLFGKPGQRADAKPLTAEEMRDIEPADIETSVDHTVAAATGLAEAEPQDEQPQQGEPDEFAFPSGG